MVDFLPYERSAIMPSGARTGEAGEFVDVVVIISPTSSTEDLRLLTVQQNKNSNNAIGADKKKKIIINLMQGLFLSKTHF